MRLKNVVEYLDDTTNVSEQMTAISTGEVSIAFESFGTALYLLIVLPTGASITGGL